jgi:DNA-binding NtrC family response regulator
MPAKARSLLVVDDDGSVVSWLEDELREAGFQVKGVSSGAAALGALERGTYDLVITDVEMPGMRGPELLARIRDKSPMQPVLLMTAFGSIELAVASVQAGAADFLAKPFPIGALLHAIERALRERRMRKEIVRLRGRLAAQGSGDLVARSQAMKLLLTVARKAAAIKSPVLITGESGVGKTALARFIHDEGLGGEAPFLELNCAALPSALVEAELFGVRKGAFTDAKETRPGLFEQADGGTLFLDELGELGLEVQPKLLKALESGRARQVGGTKEHTFAVRLIAATNLPLEQAMKERRFRPDLYHRINVLRLDIPPLRERPEDIEALVDVFIHRASQRVGRSPVGIAGDAMRWILAQPWTGNARELSNALERAVALSDHDTLVLEDFYRPGGAPAAPLLDDAVARDMTLEQLEVEYLRRVLKKTQGNKTLAAQILGVDRRTVYRKVAELGLEDSEER